MQSAITFGADPEVFLCDEDGNLVPAGELVPDGKAFDPDDGPELVRDGVLLELRPRPARSVDEAVNNIKGTLERAHALAARHGLYLRIAASMPVTASTLARCTPDALIFGCDPDWSAYTGRKQVIKVDAAAHPWRYAGGHVHIGTDALHKPEDYTTLCRIFDLFVGMPLVMMDHGKESTRRRRLYGRAGSFRPQPHGFEWRVPSNFWLRSPALAHAVFELSELAYRIWESGEGRMVLGLLDAAEIGSSVIQAAVNGSDTHTAQRILADAASLLEHNLFPPELWDMASGLMRREELPFASLPIEWSFGADRILNPVPAVVRAGV